MAPYLKGFHLTIVMWRGGRDAEGWKLSETDNSSIMSLQSFESLDVTRGGAHVLNLAMGAAYDPNKCEDEDEAAADHRLDRHFAKGRLYAPSTGVLSALPRLHTDLAALRKLSSAKLPPLRVLRLCIIIQVFYGFADASGKGFGAIVTEARDCKGLHKGWLSDEITLTSGLSYRVGILTAGEESESSNYKELGNCVDTTEVEAREGRLKNCEFFLFTDNSTAESCSYRGSSKSPALHSLVIRLHKLEMDYVITVHLIHVSGTRMITQGIDGCSRGVLLEGVMAGFDMMHFVDLAKPAIEMHEPLLDWVQTWTERDCLEPLTPEG